jgi:hypothetical protein
MKTRLQLPRFVSSLGILLASISAGHTAHAASITYTFTNQIWTGFNFNEAYAAGSVKGSLTAVTVNATLNASTNYTYADDLAVYVAGSPLALGGLLQVGGFSNLNATQKYNWANGASNASNTPVTGTVTLSTPLLFNPTTNQTMSIWIGNGYGAAGTSGTFTGSITLEGLELNTGVAAVPESGSLLPVMFVAVAMASRRRGRGANPSSNGEAGTAAS